MSAGMCWARSELRYLPELARDLACVVVSVEYRLAPETLYSGSVEDHYAALKWMHGAAAELRLDPARMALLGESAGGTHTALPAIAARDRGEVPGAFQALVYPMLDDATGSTRMPMPWIGAVLWDADDTASAGVRSPARNLAGRACLPPRYPRG